jgi:hypothetical protein
MKQNALRNVIFKTKFIFYFKASNSLHNKIYSNVCNFSYIIYKLGKLPALPVNI